MTKVVHGLCDCLPNGMGDKDASFGLIYDKVIDDGDD